MKSKNIGKSVFLILIVLLIGSSLACISFNVKQTPVGLSEENTNKINLATPKTSATDIQQTEQRIIKLFDRLERFSHEMAEQHNKLCEDASNELELLESKLLALQTKVEELSNGPQTVEAYSANPANPEKVYSNEYMYLSKPQVIIEPCGRIKITFGDEWNQYDKENFLQDLRAKAITRK